MSENIRPLRNILSQLLRAIRRIRSLLKILLLFPFGVRAHCTSTIAWSVSADGGGGAGRIELGCDTRIDIGVVIRAHRGIIRIGNHCTINPYSVLISGKGGLLIGNGVRIAAHSAIIASNHTFEDASTYIYLQGESSKGIIIEDGVWIGAGAKVLDGVIVRKGTVIAAGAVVTKSTESYSIVAGVPAAFISSRLVQSRKP